MSDCLRCGHDELDHESELGFCSVEDCSCHGFVSEDSFDPEEEEEVKELHLGDDT